jgi:hypothetical protein
MNVVPFGEKELEEYLERFDDGIRDDFEIYSNFIGGNLRDEDGKELSEEMKTDIKEALEKSLGIEYYEDATIINLIGFIFCGEGAFRYEGIDSSGIIQIRDVNGDSGLLSTKKITDQATRAQNKDNP